MVSLTYRPIFIKVLEIIEISVGGLSVICGIINLLIIYYMKVWNQFIVYVNNC